MLNNFTDLLPLTTQDAADEIVFYSQNGTGQGGRFVVLATGNNNPELSAGNFANATPGYNYPGVTNLRYENQRKFNFAPAGSFKNQVLGITLYGTAEYDLNGQKLILNPYRKVELGCVYSGETSNIQSDGIFRLSARAYSGVPIPGYVAVVSSVGDGTLQIFNPAVANELILGTGQSRVVAKVLSSSGTAFGGYADFKLTLK